MSMAAMLRRHQPGGLTMLRYIPAIFTVFLVLPAAAQDTRRKSQGFEKQLQPVAFLVGKHMGTGRSAMGGYRESLSGNWALGKTAIVVQSASKVGDMVVFQDMRVFTWDRVKARIRVRQFARGGVCTYTAKVEDGKVVLQQDDLEGMKRPEWRYTFKKDKNGFSYQVDQKSGKRFRKYVAGKLEKK
jgi:hypothetical protein